MDFGCTYTGRILKKIADKDEKIEKLKEKVFYLIEKQDYINLKDKFKELMNEIDNLDKFKENQLNEINIYLEEKLGNIINKIQRNHIKDTHGEEMFISGATLLIGMYCAEKDFKGLAENERFKKDILPAFISHKTCTDEDQFFIQELFDYTGVSIREFCSPDVFDKLSKQIKLRCFKETVDELHVNLNEKILKDKICKKLLSSISFMLSDETIKNYISNKFCEEKYCLKSCTEVLKQYYSSTDETFKDDAYYMPTWAENFISILVKNHKKNSFLLAI
jgi:hypothetical protein